MGDFKMSTSVHHRVKLLLEETNDVFSFCGSVNADYAEFASLALSEFKNALHKPELTRPELLRMIRTGTTRHKEISVDDPQCCWATFVARHIALTSNVNAEAEGDL
jgi:hypothetical protein